MVSDLFDFSIYVDARIEDIEAWYIQRFLALRNTSFADPNAHFHHYSGLSDRDATHRREGDLALDQPPEPGGEHSPHPPPRNAGAAQGRRSHDQPAAAAQALSHALRRRTGGAAPRSRASARRKSTRRNSGQYASVNQISE